MKRMQCEACGSSDIRKISDDIFECQSCGVQYEKSQIQKLLVEIDGEVKIDHSGEIENALKRAAQFLSEGDSGKALEYYNKVLDLDPDNETARQAVLRIHEGKDSALKQKQEEENIRGSAIQIVKHTLDPEDGVKIFLHTLKNAPDVTPDIYKEIEIISVTEGYYPFSIVSKQYDGKYEGTACYRKMVPYTDYKTVTDYHNKNQDGTYKQKQEAVTRYREEIERKPAHGTFTVDHFGAYIVSQSLSKQFTKIEPNQFDTSLERDLYRDEKIGKNSYQMYWNDVLLQKIEQQVSLDYGKWKHELTEVFTAKQQTVDSIAIVCDAEDRSWKERSEKVIKKAILAKAEKKVEEIIPGDFQENVQYRCSEKYSNVHSIYLPIQVIEYAYRGKFYLFAMILTQEHPMFCSYPFFAEVRETQVSAKQNIVKNTKGFPPVLLILFIIGGVLPLVALWESITDENLDASFALAFGSIGLLFLIPAIIWCVVWKKKKSASVIKAVLENDTIVNAVTNQYETEIKREYQAFFENFTDIKSIEAAVVAAKNVSTFSPNLDMVRNCIYTSVESNISTKGSADIGGKLKDTDGQELVGGCVYTVCLIDAGASKTEVAKIVREMCGVGLAVAGEMIETPHSVIKSGIEKSETEELAFRLKAVGASVEIKKGM